MKVYRVTYLIKPSDGSAQTGKVERINAPDWQQASNEAYDHAMLFQWEVIKLEYLWTEQ